MRRPEEKLHRAMFAWLTCALPKPWFVFHSPNGGGRSKAEAGVFKALGVRAGIPDLFLIGPSRVICIELKAPPKALKSGKPSKAKPAISDSQREAIAALAACGVPTLVIRSIDEAERALRELGVPLKGRAL